MKVIKSTGLVPVVVLDASALGLHANGDIVGVAPAKARELMDKKVVELADIPDGIETEDTDAVGNVEADVVMTSQALINTASVEQPKTDEAGDVTDWRALPFLSQAKLARDNGYDGEQKGEPVKAFLEAKFPA